MTKMSRRIELYREYINNPLHNEFVNEHSKIKVCPPLKKAIIILQIIYTVWFAVMFSKGITNSTTLICIGLGVANLIFRGLYSHFDLDYKSKDYKQKEKALLEKYKNKGLYVFDYIDLTRSGCGELDSNDMHICSVTKQPLSYSKWTWCAKKGNCEKCETFLTAIHQ